MTSRRTQTLVPYRAKQMFDLVADIERYPEFLPYCVALRVLDPRPGAQAGLITAEMIVAYRSFREKFRSLVRLDEPGLVIEARYVEGPFRRLTTLWRFEEREAGSLIDFNIDFEFRSFFLQTAAATVFERAFEKMSDAFVARAAEIYGAT